MEAGLEHSVLSVVSASKTQCLVSEFHFQDPFQLGYSRTTFTHHYYHLPMPLLKQYTRSLFGNQTYEAQSPEFSLTHREAFLDSASVHPWQTFQTLSRKQDLQLSHHLPSTSLKLLHPWFPTPSATPPTPDSSIHLTSWKTCGLRVEKGWSALRGHQCSQITSIYDYSSVQEF